MKRFTQSTTIVRERTWFFLPSKRVGNQIRLTTLLASASICVLTLAIVNTLTLSRDKNAFQADMPAADLAYIKKAITTVSNAFVLDQAPMHIGARLDVVERKISIHRIVNIQPTKDRDFEASLDFYYQESEQGDLSEEDLALYSFADEDQHWELHSDSLLNLNYNPIHLDGIGHLSSLTAMDITPGSSFDKNINC